MKHTSALMFFAVATVSCSGRTRTGGTSSENGSESGSEMGVTSSEGEGSGEEGSPPDQAVPDIPDDAECISNSECSMDAVCLEYACVPIDGTTFGLTVESFGPYTNSYFIHTYHVFHSGQPVAVSPPHQTANGALDWIHELPGPPAGFEVRFEPHRSLQDGEDEELVPFVLDWGVEGIADDILHAGTWEPPATSPTIVLGFQPLEFSP